MVHSVVAMLAALMLKRDCILASTVRESPQTSHLSRVDEFCTVDGSFGQDSAASVGPYWIDLSPAWNTLLFPLPHLLLANKDLFPIPHSFFTPQSPHEPFQAHPILSPTLFSF